MKICMLQYFYVTLQKPSRFCMQFNKFDEIAILGKCFKYIDVSYIIHTTYTIV